MPKRTIMPISESVDWSIEACLVSAAEKWPDARSALVLVVDKDGRMDWASARLSNSVASWLCSQFLAEVHSGDAQVDCDPQEAA